MKISMPTNGVIERRRSIDRTPCSWVLRRYNCHRSRQLDKAIIYLLDSEKKELADDGRRPRANFDEGPWAWFSVNPPSLVKFILQKLFWLDAS